VSHRARERRRRGAATLQTALFLAFAVAISVLTALALISWFERLT
jgi:hypothetical protein